MFVTEPTRTRDSARLVSAAVRMKFAMLCALSLGFLGSGEAGFAQESPLASSRETIAQWAQTRQLISQTKTGWESDREMLGQTRNLFERELKAVKAQLSKVSTHSTVADRERAEAEASLKEHSDALEAARKLVMELEAVLKQTLPLLPPPLLATLKPLSDRLPADASSTKAGVIERAQTVVALLNEIDKFNNAVSVFPEKQPNAKGETVSVDTLYLGLGAAWFVDASGEVAGVGRPTPKGWEWKLQPGITEPARNAIAMYRSQKPAAFVALPATVQ